MGVPSAQVSCPLGILIWARSCRPSCPFRKYIGADTREKNSQRAEWPPINPSIHPLFHPSPACWISTQLDSRERALAEQTHGWNYTQLYNRERALAADARLKPENQFASRLDAGFVHKQRGSEQAGRQT
jgi:hypothetical protein